MLGKDGKIKKNQQPSIMLKDLAGINSFASFSMGYFPGQGFAIDNGLLYGIQNTPDSLGNLKNTEVKPGQYNHKSNIKVRVYSIYNKGTQVGVYDLKSKNSTDKYINNKDMDAIMNIKDANGKIVEWHIGYFEPEGIRVKDGKAYILISARKNYYDKNGKIQTRTKSYIFEYVLTK